MTRALLFIACLCGCTGFEAETHGDLATSDLGASDLAGADFAGDDLSMPDLATSDLAAADLASPDLSPAAPADFVCSEPWVKGAARTETACLQRQVVVIEPGVADPQGISIAHTAAGRVAISYEYPMGADSSELHVAVFDDAALPSPSAAPITVVADGQFDRVGVRSALAAGGSDDLHLAFLEVSSGNSVQYCKLGACDAVNREQVVGNFSATGELAITIAASGPVVAAFNANSGALASYARGGSGWGAAKTLQSAIDTTAYGPGQVKLAVDDTGQPVAAYHYTVAVGLAEPRYAEFNGAAWSGPKTLDNNTLNGLYGFSIGLVLSGGVRYATYFAQSGSNTADLRLASWRAIGDTPDVSVLVQGLPVGDFANPLHRAALAVDKWGQLHVAVIEPQSPSGGVLEYRRQVRVGGQLKWIADIIDDAAVGSGDPSLVDLVVDDSGRPHIAWFNQANGSVLYATRFDR